MREDAEGTVRVQEAEDRTRRRLEAKRSAELVLEGDTTGPRHEEPRGDVLSQPQGDELGRSKPSSSSQAMELYSISGLEQPPVEWMEGCRALSVLSGENTRTCWRLLTS
eukprot:3494607-Amphidinium_carterae.1